MKRWSISLYVVFLFLHVSMHAQKDVALISDADLKDVVLEHKEFVGIPNLPSDVPTMMKNHDWVANKFLALDFRVSGLSSETLPILFAERVYDPEFKTVLFYFHIDGQAVDVRAWNQEDPFIPVLKEQDSTGEWGEIDWNNLDGEINDDWRMFGRAAADDKAPIMMLLTALRKMQASGEIPSFNIKIIFDPEEEYGSKALLSTLDTYKSKYQSDYFIVMDGPGDRSNKPSLTFGCRGIATLSLTTYGSKTPMHSGHYGNYVSNPVFKMSQILAGMKDEKGKVLIKDYYEGVTITNEDKALLNAVPFDREKINQDLFIHASEEVGGNYQEALQYPSLNVRQIGTSWKGEGLKTVIPAYATADIDVRLVPEIDGKVQLERIKQHLIENGHYVIDREPTDEERLSHANIVKMVTSRYVNSFRTDPHAYFGKKIRTSLTNTFGFDPVSIRMMGGTVPIVPLINALNVPTIIVPMVNMDNNQHSPNENIRLGNIRQGIEICRSILKTEF